MLTVVTVTEVRARLTRVLGQEKAASLMEETLTRIGRHTLETPDDLLLFAESLEGDVGLVKYIGRALKAQALLRGANASRSAAQRHTANVS